MRWGGQTVAAFLQKTLCWPSGASDWKSRADATIPVKSRGVLGTTHHREGGTEIENTDGGQESKGPRQQQGGAPQIYRCDPSDLTAQQHSRPYGLGEHRGASKKRDAQATRRPGEQ